MNNGKIIIIPNGKFKSSNYYPLKNILELEVDKRSWKKADNKSLYTISAKIIKLNNIDSIYRSDGWNSSYYIVGSHIAIYKKAFKVKNDSNDSNFFLDF